MSIIWFECFLILYYKF